MSDQYLAREDVSTIISLLPVAVEESKPGLLPGFYYIPPVKDVKTDVEVLQVFRARFPVYIDESRPSIIVPAPSDQVSMAIVRDFKVGITGYVAGISEPGLFWVPDKFTKARALAELQTQIGEARRLQFKWFEKLVSLADDDWQRYHARRMVSSLQRKACDLLGLDRDWNITIEIAAAAALEMMPCKFCRAQIHRDASVCQFCSGIVDMAKARADGYMTVTLAATAAGAK